MDNLTKHKKTLYTYVNNLTPRGEAKAKTVFHQIIDLIIENFGKAELDDYLKILDKIK